MAAATETVAMTLVDLLVDEVAMVLDGRVGEAVVTPTVVMVLVVLGAGPNADSVPTTSRPPPVVLGMEAVVA